MTVNYRALIAWFLLLIFVIFVVVRLDDKVSWNWFIVFIPLWLFDTVVIIYIVIFMIRHCISHNDPSGRSMLRKCWFLAGIGLKIVAQILICLRIEYVQSMSMFIVMTPVWMVLIMTVGDISRSVWHRMCPCPSHATCTCPTVVCKTD